MTCPVWPARPAGLAAEFTDCSSRCAGSRLWAVVKANAYGHVARVWSALSTTDGFALLNLEEAILLREQWAGKVRSCCWRASSMPMSWRCWISTA